MGIIRKNILSTTLIFIIILLSSCNIVSKDKEGISDLHGQIKTAISTYISESGDKTLTFGDGHSVNNVSSLLNKLQSKIKYGKEEYGPYLVGLESINRSAYKIVVSDENVSILKAEKDSLEIVKIK